MNIRGTSFHCLLALFLSLSAFVGRANSLRKDTVYQLAYVKTLKKDYNSINWSKKTQYPLNSSYYIQNSQQQLSFLKKVSKEIASAQALGNNYFPYIEEELSKNNLPASFKWIPLTVSGMVNSYYGSTGEAGIWQIPYVIGIKYGLRQDRLVDERLDYQKNTSTAIKYIKDLIIEFGDTTTALHAFFNGIGAMKYAYSKTATIRFKNKNALNNFIYNHLPNNTRDLLFIWNEISATLSHDKNITKTSFTPLHMAAMESTTIEQLTYIKAIGKQMEIGSEIIKLQNPTLISDFIPENFNLNLPLGRKKDFLARYEKIYAYQDSLKNNPKKRVIRPSGYVAPPKGAEKKHYTVRSGDNLGTIASKFGVRISQIRGWNNLRGDMIYAGQKLVIYGPKNVNFNKTSSKPQPTTPTQNTASTKGGFVHYTVKSGDTLWGIAQKYPGVSADDIQKWNAIGANIDVGQILKIKQP